VALTVNFVKVPDASSYFNMDDVYRIVPQSDGTARFYYDGDEFFSKSYGVNLAAAIAGVDTLITPTAL
jgi:hypothetical protein